LLRSDQEALRAAFGYSSLRGNEGLPLAGPESQAIWSEGSCNDHEQ